MNANRNNRKSRKSRAYKEQFEETAKNYNDVQKLGQNYTTTTTTVTNYNDPHPHFISPHPKTSP
jgi:hypothetical protein